MNVIAGLELLRKRITNKPDDVILEFATLEARLLENLEAERKYGYAEANQVQRARIIDSLNQFTFQYLRVTFNELCITATQEMVETGTVTEHVRCFVSLPSEGYDILFQALREVLEVQPYFWEVMRASERYLGDTIGGSIAQHIARSHCYFVDVSDGDFNVGIELGMIKMYPGRPIVLLRRQNADIDYQGIAGHLYLTYPSWNDKKFNSNEFISVLKTEIEKKESLRTLQGTAHYLSLLTLQESWIADDVAQRLPKGYQTIEALLQADPNIVKRKLGLPHSGIIKDIQEYLVQLLRDNM